MSSYFTHYIKRPLAHARINAHNYICTGIWPFLKESRNSMVCIHGAFECGHLSFSD